MRRTIVLVTLMIAAVVLGTSAVAYAEQSDKQSDQSSPETTSGETVGPITSENHAWGNYHWGRTANPFTLQLGDNVSTAWDGYLGKASSDWSKSTVLDAPVAQGGTTANRCRPTSGRVEVCNAKYGYNGWLGLASIWLTNGHITQGTTKVNDTYFSLSRYNYTSEKQHVMCQEIGHTFGLGHTSEDGTSQNTCMDYYQNKSDGDTTSTAPNQHDYDQLNTIYQHLDSLNTVATNAASKHPAAMRNMNANDPKQWGKQIEKHGREEVYVRDFGDGHQVLTVVIRPEETGSEENTSEENTSQEKAKPEE